jgi:hypothetical protein
MLYRNTKTGVIIDVESEMKGAWEPVKAPAPEKKPAKKSGGKKK